MRYDPIAGPDSKAWLDLTEAERLEGVIRFHRKAKLKGGNLRVHAAVHAVVENQLAEGHAAARAALRRLLDEGLDRHEAVHAIGSVVATQIYQAMRGATFDSETYEKDLAELSAASWSRMAEAEDE